MESAYITANPPRSSTIYITRKYNTNHNEFTKVFKNNNNRTL